MKIELHSDHEGKPEGCIDIVVEIEGREVIRHQYANAGVISRTAESGSTGAPTAAWQGVMSGVCVKCSEVTQPIASVAGLLLCPGCAAVLLEGLRALQLGDIAGWPRFFNLLSCKACGHSQPWHKEHRPRHRFTLEEKA